LVLLPPGTDPHTFQPVPQDVAAVSDAHVVFANGVGLERFLEPLLESAGEGAALVPVSHGVDLIRFEGGGAEAEEHGGPAEDPTAGFDPHTWFDPNNVIVWVRNIERALGSLDPGNAARYRANADAYESELDVLDDWIAQQIAQVPEPDRLLVTDHATFGYFARRYGFEQVGTLLPGYSTLSQPSAQELAELEEAIDALDVRAVFVGLTVSPELAERVANDTGTQLVFLYTGSLSEPGGPADDYISFMRYNVSAIVQALR
jgi:ABC-type Zn uptake system ZnuABC Zn-binding protein ZnuA